MHETEREADAARSRNRRPPTSASPPSTTYHGYTAHTEAPRRTVQLAMQRRRYREIFFFTQIFHSTSYICCGALVWLNKRSRIYTSCWSGILVYSQWHRTIFGELLYVYDDTEWMRIVASTAEFCFNVLCCIYKTCDIYVVYTFLLYYVVYVYTYILYIGIHIHIYWNVCWFCKAWGRIFCIIYAHFTLVCIIQHEYIFSKNKN